MKFRMRIVFFVSILTVLVLTGCPNPTSDSPEDALEDSAVTLLAIPGVVAPVRGAVPVTTPIDTEQYTGTITWSGIPATFAVTTVYTATVTLTAKSGRTLSGVAANSFTVAGATATNAADSGIVTAVFPITGALSDIDVTFTGAEQTGGASNSVTTTGLELTFSVDPTTLSVADITVSGATKGVLSGTGTTRSLAISAITVADGGTVSITVTSPAGFAITGSPKTAVVYKAPIPVTLLAIPGIVAPVRGAVPVTTPIDTEQYPGTITWSGTPATFAATTVYTATATLTAKSGRTLSGVAANSFTVAGATATNAADSGIVTAVFPETYAAPLNLTMISVPTGSYQRDVTPANVSTLSAFLMSEKEITRTQFLAVMGTDPSEVSKSSGTGDPVQQTTWYPAIDFCNKLSLAEGLTPVYTVEGVDFTTLSYGDIPVASDADWNAAVATWTNTGYRLPTEMEWIWAAMGATSDRSNGYTGTGTNTTGYTKKYAGSTETGTDIVNIASYVWYNANSPDTTQPVGTKLKNELNLFDMNGNVYEWCWDWYALYPADGQTDYTGPATGTGRVLIGGSIGNNPGNCTVSYREPNGINPQAVSYGYGFRVVRR